MAWSVYTHASVGDVRRPRPLGQCDRCGFTYNRDHLKWQYDWAGLKEMNRGILVCHKCMDAVQPQLQAITIPPDPVAIMNPRPGEFSGTIYRASPDALYMSATPSQIVVQHSTGNTTTEVGDRSPIVTQNSSLPLLVEVTVTPYPDPTAGDGGYTRMPGAST